MKIRVSIFLAVLITVIFGFSFGVDAKLNRDQIQKLNLLYQIKNIQGGISTVLQSQGKSFAPYQAAAQSTTSVLQNELKQYGLSASYIAQLDDINSKTSGKWAASFTSKSLLPTEKRKKLGGLQLKTASVSKSMAVGYVPAYSSLPTDLFDWRNVNGKNYMTSVKDQGECGGCWAFAAAGALEGEINAYYGKSLNEDLSEQDLISCSGAGSCDGGYLDLALNYVYNTGVVQENCLPFIESNGSCSAKCSNGEVWKISNFSYAGNSVEEVQQTLVSKGPIVAAMPIYEDFYYYTGGIYRHVSGNFTGTYHAVVIAGYGESGGVPYWIVKNSWDTDWGENGYFRIYYDGLILDTRYYLAIDAPVPPAGTAKCEDADEDGYCVWGLGEKPSDCPVCDDVIQDCDDSNASIYQNCGSQTTCTTESSCGTDGYVGSAYCKAGTNAVYRDYKNYSCTNGTCSSATEARLQQTCTSTQSCFNGVCATRGITFISPAGGETWRQGTLQGIRWATEGTDDGTTFSVFLINSFSNQSTQIASDIIGIAKPVLYPWTSSFGWAIPADLAVGEYKIRAVSNTNPPVEGLSNSFTITDQPVSASITVTAPVAGESWQQGTPRDIKWISSGFSGSSDKVKVVLINNLNNQETVIDPSVLATNNIYSWTVPISVALGQYKIKVSYESGSTVVSGTSPVFNITQGSGQSITITAPASGDSWALGTKQNITWTSAGITGTATTTIYIVSETNPNYPTQIATNVSVVGGKYEWTLPFTIAPGRYRVSFIAGAVQAKSDYFSITDPTPGPFKITYPNGGEELIQGTPSEFRWERPYNLASENLSISIRTPSGFNKTIVSSVAIGADRAGWGVPATFDGVDSARSDYQACGTIKSASTGAILATDCSDNYFSIIKDPGPLMLTYPNGGETFSAGQSLTVKYNISTNHSQYGGFSIASINLIGGEASNSGYYYNLNNAAINPSSCGVVLPSNVPDGKYKVEIRASFYQGGSGDVVYTDTSDFAFTINSASTQPFIKVTYPNGGQVLTFGNKYTFKWDSYGAGSEVYLTLTNYKENGSIEWSCSLTGANAVPNTGQYEFTIDDSVCYGLTKAIGSRVKFQVKDTSQTKQDQSDNYFTIGAGGAEADNVFKFGTGDSDWLPVVGDWDGNGSATAGVYDPPSYFYLKNANAAGAAEISFGYGEPRAGWLPISGNWTGRSDKVQSIGLYDPSTSVFYLKNSNTAGYADIYVGFGAAGAGWKPLAGDWNGDGKTTIGAYDPSAKLFYLKNSNTTGYADIYVAFSGASASWLPIAGNWDGIGGASIGLYDPATSTFHLRNNNTSDATNDIAFVFGTPNSGFKPIAGDWNSDGKTEVGLYDPATSTFYLKNSLPLTAPSVSRKEVAVTDPQNFTASINDAIKSIYAQIQALINK